jgi:hypothetical protein
MQKFLKTLALAGAVAAALTGCGGPTQDMLKADVTQAMDVALPKDFSKLEFEEPPPFNGKPAPTLVFRGADSTIIAVGKPYLHDRFNTWMSQPGLAVTKSGRWFVFSYESDLETEAGGIFDVAKPCLDAGCRRFASTRPVSIDAAKRWYFDSDQFTPERYRALFGEDAPAKREPA